MYPDRLVFFVGLGFLLGTFIVSFVSAEWLVFAAALGAAVCFLVVGYGKNLNFLLGLFLLGGFLFGGFHCLKYEEKTNNFSVPAVLREVEAEVVSEPYAKNGSQRFLLEVGGGYKLMIYASVYPEFRYGDLIKITGIPQPAPADGYGEYLKKLGAVGSVFYPRLDISGARRGGLRGWLYDLRSAAEKNITLVLPFSEAALLNGLVFGDTEEFSESFREAMQNSGTTHLTALSGYNIAVVASAALSFFLLLIRRRLAVGAAALAILLFVLMTGAEPSVVRAALMGGLVLLAGESGRLYDLKNAITLVAAVMVFFNPKILVYDLGFQLSFLALLGIVYLAPALANFFKIKNPTPDSWRGLILSSLSAQLAVAPLLLYQFGFVSWSGILVNIFVLPLVPFVMGIGFLAAVLGFVGFGVISWLAWPFLFLIRQVIEIGAQLQTLVFQPVAWQIAVYWLVLVIFVGSQLRQQHAGNSE